MAKEYNDEQIVKLFGKQMEKLGERRAELVQESLEQRTILEQRMEQIRAQNKALQEQWDQTIESHEDAFADTAKAVEYDTTRLQKKYLSEHMMTTNSSSIPCLLERSEIASCYRTHKGVHGACDAFVEALSDCAGKTITAK